MKKVLVTLNNFYPEISSLAQLYSDLCLELSKEYELTVICAIPSYTGNIEEKYTKKKFYFEKYGNISVIRIRVKSFDKASKKSRVISHVGYFLGALRATRYVKNVSLVVAVSQPPILGGIIGLWHSIRNRCPLIYNIQDFNPEQIEAVNYSRNKLLLHLLRKIDMITCRRSKCISVVSDDMRETIAKRFGNKKLPKCISINNWVNEKKLFPLDRNDEKVYQFKKKYGCSDKTVFMYSGNIGLIYDLKNVMTCIMKFKNRNDIVFLFVGEGNTKRILEEMVEKEKAENVLFAPYQKEEELLYSLNAADIHFVVNCKGMKGVASPSKLYGIMAVGKPIIGMLENGMEARKIIQVAECGLTVEPGDYSELESVIEFLADNPEQAKNMGERGRRFYCEKMGREKSIAEYKSLLATYIG